MRPKEFDEDKALNAAVMTFWQRGYSGTSMQDLQDAMGISRASLYNTYKSKDELFLRSLGAYLRLIGDMIDQLLREAPTARAGIEAVLRFTVTREGHKKWPRGCLFAFGTLEFEALDAKSKRLLHDVRKRRQERLAERLRQGAEAGELPANADVEALAAHFTVVIDGLNVQGRLGFSPEEGEAAVAAAMRAFG